MSAKDNLSRFIQTLKDDPNSDIEEIQELLSDNLLDVIRASPKLFLQLCHTLTDALIKSGRAVCGINMISEAITKYQSHPNQLTQLHSDLCLLCLKSKCLKPASEILEIDFTEIKKTEERDKDVRYVLLYYYYGGLIYAATKNFDRAAHYLEIVLTMPANVMNPIMQEAYKKFILLTLLIDGKLPENLLPKYTSQCVLRQRRQTGQSYLKLAAEYSSLNKEKIERAIAANSCNYERDENMGLIKQCLTQVHKRNIQRLTKTFLTLPLRDVANYVGLASDKEAEMYILNMIDDGEIAATINQKDSMVVFHDNTERFDSVTVFQKLQDDIGITQNLIQTLKKMDSESGGETKGSCKMSE